MRNWISRRAAALIFLFSLLFDDLADWCSSDYFFDVFLFLSETLTSCYQQVMIVYLCIFFRKSNNHRSEDSRKRRNKRRKEFLKNKKKREFENKRSKEADMESNVMWLQNENRLLKSVNEKSQGYEHQHTVKV